MSAVNDPTPQAPQPTPAGSDAIQAAPPANPSAVQASPPAEAPPIPLPPRPRPAPLSPEELARAMGRLDRMLLALVVVLTALLAAFPVRNSDFFFHMATARDWLAGRFHLGEDPYTFAGTGAWVNHSWLYDLLVYGLYHLGGPAVVVAKTALLLGLVVVMLTIRRRGRSLWLPGVCTALSVVAMSPGFVMQPAIFSLLFLGITLALLMRHDLRDEPEAADRKHRHAAPPVPWLGEPADRPLWLLVPVFAVWVNLDAWFVLGPLAVALYLAGSLADARRPGAWRPLAAVLVAGVAACLLSPFTIHGLNLPGEIGARGVLHVLEGDESFARLLGSPLQGDYFRPETGLTVAGLAFFPLAALGLASFVLPGGVRWGRAAVFGGFLVLAVALARAVPFFAVVAGPIAALNYQDFAARRYGPGPVTTGWLKEWSLAGRGLSVLAAFLLAVLAWPGWLFALPGVGRAEMAEARRVGLKVVEPEGLARVAAQFDAWHRDGTLTDADRGLNLEPDVNAALCWLCKDYRPKSFFDSRFENYTPELAAEYVALRRVFEPAEVADLKPLTEQEDKWRPAFEKHGITYLIASDGARGGYLAVRARCAGLEGAPALVTLFEDGHAAVFVPRQKSLTPHGNTYLAEMRARLRAANILLPSLPPPAGDEGRFKGKEFDAWALAYGPDAERLPAAAPKPAQPQPWYVRLAFGSGSPPPAAADAAAYRLAAEDTAFRHHYDNVMRPAAARLFAAFAGKAVGRSGNGLADAYDVGTLFHFTFIRPPLPVEIDEKGPVFIGPSAPIMLAVRSARRAILENPQDAEGYFQLGLAYQALERQSDEHVLSGRMPLLGELRHVQTVTALRTAARLDPDHVGAHFWLYVVFGKAGYADLQLKHLGDLTAAIRRAPPASASDLKAFVDRYALPLRRLTTAGESADALKKFDEWVKALEDEHGKLEKAVKDNLNTYAVRSEKKSVLDKARIALELNLGDKALQALLDSNALEFGPQGAQLQLQLMMQQGRLEDLRAQLVPADEKDRQEQPDNIDKAFGPGAYDRYRMLLSAGEGDYAEADASLERAGRALLTNADFLKALRQDVTRPGILLNLPIPESQLRKDEGPLTKLNFQELAAMQAAKIILEGAPEPGPADWLLKKRMAWGQRRSVVLPLGTALSAASDFETLRGVLRLEVGDVAGAKKCFKRALFADEKQDDLDAPFAHNSSGLAIAYRYLMAVEKKE